MNWIEGGLAEGHNRWLRTQLAHRQAEADGIEARLGAYVNLVVDAPVVATSLDGTTVQGEGWHVDEAANIDLATVDRVLGWRDK